MALIKGNRSESSAGPEQSAEPASVRKGVIFRSRMDHSAAPASEPEPLVEGDEGFEPGLSGVQKAATSTRILNHRATHVTSTLPPMASAVRIPTGGAEAMAAAENAPEVSATPAAPVVYQQAVPVDQAIIEEAQQRAQAMLQEAQAAANQMLMEYQQQAQQMMEQANAQIQAAAEQVQRQAQEIGFQQGYEQGLQQGAMTAQQQVYQQLVESRDIFIQAVRQRHLLLASAEPQLARLSVKIAEKLVGQELQLNQDAILGIVRVALAGIGDREEVSIRVNPADYDRVVAHRSDYEKMIDGLKKFHVSADAAIDPGGCAIETNLGNIDARLNTRVAALTLGVEEQAQLHEKEVSEAVQSLNPDVPEIPEPQFEAAPPMGEEQ